jgi:FixJ family two-component response regulator
MEWSTIPIIDDDQFIRDGCRMVLSERGHSMEICMNGTAFSAGPAFPHDSL